MENPITMDDLGVPLFSETPISSHLKMDGWKTGLSFWGPAYFQVQTAVRFRECSYPRTWDSNSWVSSKPIKVQENVGPDVHEDSPYEPCF